MEVVDENPICKPYYDPKSACANIFDRKPNNKTSLRYHLSIQKGYCCLTKIAGDSHNIAHALNDRIDSVNPGMVRTFCWITKNKTLQKTYIVT